MKDYENEQQDPVINVIGLSKSFRIYDHPFDRLKDLVSLTRRKRYVVKRVLHELSFHVHRGNWD